MSHKHDADTSQRRFSGVPPILLYEYNTVYKYTLCLPREKERSEADCRATGLGGYVAVVTAPSGNKMETAPKTLT